MSIVTRRDKTFKPSCYCSCGKSLWLGQENHKHYLKNGEDISEHEHVQNVRDLHNLYFTIRDAEREVKNG